MWGSFHLWEPDEGPFNEEKDKDAAQRRFILLDKGARPAARGLSSRGRRSSRSSSGRGARADLRRTTLLRACRC